MPMTDLDLVPAFANHKKTLHLLSEDKHNNASSEFLTDSPELAIAFDEVKSEYEFNCCGKHPSCFRSVDAILQVQGKIYFIEFKNEKICGDEIHLKISDTTIIFNDICSTSIDLLRKVCTFILVYNKDKNKLTKHEVESNILAAPYYNSIADNVEKLSSQPYHLVRFKLHRFRKTFFSDVFTFNETELKKFLTEHNLRVS